MNQYWRLELFRTRSENRYSADSDDRFEYLGDMNSIWQLWYSLHKELKYPHVYVYHITGFECDPEKGLHGLNTVKEKQQ